MLTFNRTNLELKLRLIDFGKEKDDAFNRTNLELKLKSARNVEAPGTFNRTNLELKHVYAPKVVPQY